MDMYMFLWLPMHHIYITDHPFSINTDKRKLYLYLVGFFPIHSILLVILGKDCLYKSWVECKLLVSFIKVPLVGPDFIVF